LCLGVSASGWAQDVRSQVHTGNQHFQANEYTEALNKYEQALADNPQATIARFNQGNVYYRLDDLEQAQKAYREVAAETKDMSLVAKAKYNLGNTHFQQGLKLQDGNLQKALEAMRDSITQWRSTLELEPENVNAARNIEVARLKIKDILDQINKQQDPNQPQDPNQSQQQQDQQRQPGEDQPQDQAGQDPNQDTGQDPNQAPPQDPNEGQDPNQAKESPSQEPQEPQEPQQDMTAQAILDKEQRQKDQRQQQQVMRRRPVDKDW
jgi:Ca-activated chloride channel family protein